MLKEEFLDWQRRIDPSRLPGGMSGFQDPYDAAMAGDWKSAAEHWHRTGDPYREALSLAEGEEGWV